MLNTSCIPVRCTYIAKHVDAEVEREGVKCPALYHEEDERPEASKVENGIHAGLVLINWLGIEQEVKRDKRLSISSSTEHEDGRIIVVSFGTFSIGISIKKIHRVILGHPVKSKIILIQSIGRSLRRYRVENNGCTPL